MALFAGARKTRRNMVRPRCLLICCRVAGVALEREALELSDGGTFVAVVALQRGVPAHKRKPVLVISNSLQCHLPALHGVAAFTI